MKKTAIILSSLLLCLGGLPALAQENQARKATVSASFAAEGCNLQAVNDGKTVKSAKATPDQYYTNLQGEEHYGETHWVEYALPYNVQFTMSKVVWYANDSTVLLPDTAYIEYWNRATEEWVWAAAVGSKADSYNSNYSLDFASDRVRLLMHSPAATGLIEWQLWGTRLCSQEITITPYIKVNGGGYEQVNYATARQGDTVTLLVESDMDDEEFESCTWSGPNKFSASGTSVTLSDVTAATGGSYKATFTNVCGQKFTQSLLVNIAELPTGALYDWPEYSTHLSYDFRDEYPDLEPPTKFLNDDSHVVGKVAKGWWCFRWGKNRRSEVTDAAIDRLLDRMNTDFGYFRDTMGWPPDDRAKNGYYSTVDLYGSGLNDGADTTALGGWQGANWYNGKSWPMVLISYYPVASFDPNCKYNDREGQMGAVVHEGIHAVLAGLPGCRNAAWFHEGGNTWLQQQYSVEVEQVPAKNRSVGFLDCGSFIAPFMPIECYSGWLQDDSFGGPSAEGVNMYNEDGQVCTWRNLIGGVQYSNAFPTALGEIMGHKSIAWIWRHCESRVLEGMADSLGDLQMRRLIMEYRARQALFDLGDWSYAFRNITSANTGVTIKAEWQPYWINCESWKSTPYAKTTADDEGWLTPEYRTTPGWSGANQIPLTVTGDTCSVVFEPLGENMTCQLVYRSENGYAYYSEPVKCGECTLAMPEKPSNDIVIAVICNTDYIYKGEETRKAHFDYRLKMGRNVTKKASITTKHFDKWTLKMEKNPYITGISTIEKEATRELTFSVDKTVASPGDKITVECSKELARAASVSLLTASGKLCASYRLSERGTIELPANMGKGIYLLQFGTDECRQSIKMVIK